jgi:glycosyltransferase involved in cell wall biosynthesis
MHVLMITQKLDSADPMLGFVMGWVRALAARVQHLNILCLEQADGVAMEELPPNVQVWSMGKERGHGRLRMAYRFYRVLTRVINQTDVIFCHMVPRYAWMAAPVAMSYPVPQVLWYTHRQVTLGLKAALAVSRRVATAVPTSFPIQSSKVRALGHGIDTSVFAPDPTIPRDDPPLIVHVARLMPIKHQATLLNALSLLENKKARVALVGTVPPGQDMTYLDHLKNAAENLGISDRVIFTGAQKPAAVRDLMRRATAAVNLSPEGLFDKAALESMLVGVPTIVSSAAFEGLYGEHAPLLRITAPDDVDGLADRLDDLLAMDAQKYNAVGEAVRVRTAEAHSLDGLMDRLVNLLAEVANIG